MELIDCIFFLQRLSLDEEIVIKFFGSVFIGFPSDSKGMLLFIVKMVIILMLIETIFAIIKEMLHLRM